MGSGAACGTGLPNRWKASDTRARVCLCGLKAGRPDKHITWGVIAFFSGGGEVKVDLRGLVGNAGTGFGCGYRVWRGLLGVARCWVAMQCHFPRWARARFIRLMELFDIWVFFCSLFLSVSSSPTIYSHTRP